MSETYRVDCYIVNELINSVQFGDIDDASEYSGNVQKKNSDISKIKIYKNERPYMTFMIDNGNVKVLWGK